MENRHRLYLLFADLLEYPTSATKQRSNECFELISCIHPPAGEIFAVFHSWVVQTRFEQVEEIYTCTFDLQGICCPYVGHYLFGDNYRRSWFMAQLNAGYHAKGFSSSNELPDHIAVILRFLGQDDESEFCRVLLGEGLKPGVEKMIQAFGEDSHHPYGELLKSLGMLLIGGMATGEHMMSEAGMGGLPHD
jgi:nitrate reductase delta subunit